MLMGERVIESRLKAKTTGILLGYQSFRAARVRKNCPRPDTLRISKNIASIEPSSAGGEDAANAKVDEVNIAP